VAGPRVEVRNLQDAPVDTGRAARAAALAWGEAAGDTSLSLVLVDEPAIVALNREHCGRDRSTDVLAYAGDPEEECAGEIVVCVAVAAEQAVGARHDLDTEVAFLAAHGALHLQGMDDATEEGRRAMIARQEGIIRQLAAPPGQPPC